MPLDKVPCVHLSDQAFGTQWTPLTMVSLNRPCSVAGSHQYHGVHIGSPGHG